MNISLTPELESRVRARVESGYYNNASEVIREALRFFEQNEALVQRMKLNALKEELAAGEAQARRGDFAEQSMGDLVKELKGE